MLATIHQVCTYLLIVLGVVHALFTLHAYDELLSPNAVWFVGAGIALILAGFLNIVLARGAAAHDRVVTVLCHVANFLCLALAVMSVFAVREPQAYVGVALLALMTLTAYRLT